MPLTALAIRALQPREREFTVSDGGSLFLVVTPSGGKLWRYNFRFGGKQKKLAIGGFPVVSLADARVARDAAKLLLAQGLDPAAAKQDRKRPVVPANVPAMPTLRTMARAYVGKRQREGAVPATLDKYEWAMAAVGDDLLDRPIDQVLKTDLLARLRVFEAAGNLEKVKRARTLVSRVYDYAAAEGHEVARPPAAGISGSLATRRAIHHAALLDADEVGGLLRAIDAYRGDPSTMSLLRLSPLLVLRSAEIRNLRWRFVSWDDDLIRLPGESMKVVKGRRRDHIVPLSTQARQALEAALPWSSPKGRDGGDTLVMASLRSKGRPPSENTFNAACRRMGYTVDEVTHHGLRSTFSTWMNEAGWNKDWVEVQLHHLDPDQTRGAYNAALYLDGRRELMQAWADRLDAAKARPPRQG